MSGLFDIINSINSKKNNLLEEGIPEKEYVPFIINKNFSYFSDTVMHANELNSKPLIPKKYQYEYYLKSIRPRKRFSKWFKKTDSPNLDLIKKYYNVSNKKAIEYLNILSKEQIAFISNEMDEGGVD